MERQVFMDKLSEFLMVEQGGLELYRIALSRATNPETKQRYQEFVEQTNRHRTILIRLIERLGGDPSYVSPTARRPGKSIVPAGCSYKGGWT
jgi:rubrerythrin